MTRSSSWRRVGRQLAGGDPAEQATGGRTSGSSVTTAPASCSSGSRSSRPGRPSGTRRSAGAWPAPSRPRSSAAAVIPTSRRRFGRWMKNAMAEVDEVDRQRERAATAAGTAPDPRIDDQAEAGQRQPRPDDDRAVRLRPQQARTTRLSDSTVARRVRSVNGSRIDGRNRPTARAMWATSRIGKRLAGIAADCRAPAAAAPSARPDGLERDPVALGRRARVTAEPGGLERARDLRLAVDEDARRQQAPPGRSSSRRAARERHEHARRSGWRARRRTAARRSAGCPRGRGPGAPAGCGARWRGSPRSAIGSVSTPRTPRRPELHRGDREDPRAAADVEDAGAGQLAAIRERLERRQAQPGRRVQAGPERHPRIEREDDVVRRAPMAPPGRPDDEPPADPQDREVGLPGLGPVGLVDEPGPQLADRPQPERLEVARAPRRRRRRSRSAAARSRAGT